jgi:hypothetical protein
MSIPNDATVGILNVQLRADVSAYTAAMNAAVADIKKIGDALQRDLEPRQKAINAAVRDFLGADQIRRAQEYTDAVKKLGDVSRASEAEQRTITKAVSDSLDTYKRLGESAPAALTNLRKATTDAVQPAETLHASFLSMTASFISAQAVIGIAKTTFGVLTDAIKDSITAANEAEHAHAQVTAALRAQGQATPRVIDAYGQYATALQKTTTYQDDALEGAEALLVTVGNVMPKDMNRALEAVTNLAAGMNIDLTSAAQNVAKAAEGNVGSLRKMGVEVDASKVKAQGFGAVLDAINDKFAGQAAAIAGTYEGRLTQLANTWNNVQESVGRAITTNQTVLDLLDAINGTIDTNTKELNQNIAVNQAISEAVILSVRAFAELAHAIDLVQTGGSGFMITLRNMGASLGNIGIAALEAGKSLVFLTGGGPSATKRYDEMIRPLRDAVAELGQRNEATTERSVTLGMAFDEIRGRADALAKQLENTRGQTRQLTEALGGVGNPPGGGLSGTLDALSEHDKLFGLDLINRAKALVAALGDVGNVTQLTTHTQQDLWSATNQALDVYRRLGIEAPAAIRHVHDALSPLVGDIAALNANFAKLIDTNPAHRFNGLPPAVPILQDPTPPRPRPVVDFRFSTIANQRLSDLVRPGGNTGAQDWLAKSGFASVGLGAPPSALSSYADALKQSFSGKAFGDDLAKAIMGAIQGGGNVGDAAGSLIGSELGSSASKAFGSGLQGALGKTVGGAVAASLPAIGALLGPLAGKLIDKIVSIFTGGEGAKANDLRDQLKAKFGDAAGAGLQAAVEALGDVPGLQAAYDRFMHAGTQKDVQGSFDALNKVIGATNDTLTKYGLSLDDLKTPQQQFGDALKDVFTLQGVGFSNDQIARGMADSLNGLLSVALDTGQKLPSALEPYLDSLAQAGRLNDDLKKKILGVADPAPWQDMQTAAEKYHISVDALGNGFKQAKLDDTVKQLVSDWKLLTEHGADANAVMDGMRESVQGVIDDALKFGETIPDTMRPMIEKMIEASELTDGQGEKLTDLTKLSFSHDLSEDFQALIDKLDELIDHINGPGGLAASLANLPQPKINWPAPPGSTVSAQQQADYNASIGDLSKGSWIGKQWVLNTPQMAGGGVVLPRPGGTLVNMAEKGYPETILPGDWSALVASAGRMPNFGASLAGVGISSLDAGLAGGKALGLTIKIEPSDVLIDGARAGRVLWKPMVEDLQRRGVTR